MKKILKWLGKVSSIICPIKALFPLTLIVLLIICCIFTTGCSSNKQIRTFADNFRINLDKEIDASNTFISEYEKANFDTDNGIYAFQKIISNHLQTFNNFLDSYQATCPTTAPQDLKDSVNLAKEGTSKIIAGITTINTALTDLSDSQLLSGQNLFDDGIDLLSQSTSKYNNFVDSFNTKSGYNSTNFGFSILIGTGVLWLLSLLVVNPLTKYFDKRRLTSQYANSNMPLEEQGISQNTASLFTRTYILVDVIVMSVAGFLLGSLVGWYFIGISWKVRHWPGLIAFIGFSFLGSYLFW